MDAIQFLNTDFAQGNNQIRHYDIQIQSMFKFMITIYTTILGSSITILKIPNHTNLLPLVIFILSVSIILGLFFEWYVVEIRFYYVKTARFINQIRKNYQDEIKDDIKDDITDDTRYYTDPHEPKFLSLSSSHIILLIVICLINGFAAGVLLKVLFTYISLILLVCLVIVLLILQFLIIGISLHNKEIGHEGK